jgi:hypothetical protein
MFFRHLISRSLKLSMNNKFFLLLLLAFSYKSLVWGSDISLTYRSFTTEEKKKMQLVSEYRMLVLEKNKFALVTPCYPCIGTVFYGTNTDGKQITTVFHIVHNSDIHNLVKNIASVYPSGTGLKMIAFTKQLDKEKFKRDNQAATQLSQKKWLLNIASTIQGTFDLPEESCRIIMVDDSVQIEPQYAYSIVVESSLDEQGFPTIYLCDPFTIVPKNILYRYVDRLLEQYNHSVETYTLNSDGVALFPFMYAHNGLRKLIQLQTKTD